MKTIFNLFGNETSLIFRPHTPNAPILSGLLYNDSMEHAKFFYRVHLRVLIGSARGVPFPLLRLPLLSAPVVSVRKFPLRFFAIR